MNDANFGNFMNSAELSAWAAFANVVKFFLGKTKAPNYTEFIETLLTSLHQLGANMSIKLHFLHSHLACIAENLGDVSDDQGDRYHQQISDMEVVVVVVVDYPTPSEGWRHGGRPWSPRSRATPQGMDQRS